MKTLITVLFVAGSVAMPIVCLHAGVPIDRTITGTVVTYGSSPTINGTNGYWFLSSALTPAARTFLTANNGKTMQFFVQGDFWSPVQGTITELYSADGVVFRRAAVAPPPAKPAVSSATLTGKIISARVGSKMVYYIEANGKRYQLPVDDPATPVAVRSAIAANVGKSMTLTGSGWFSGLAASSLGMKTGAQAASTLVSIKSLTGALVTTLFRIR
jgi:hypothetical protein